MAFRRPNNSIQGYRFSANLFLLVLLLAIVILLSSQISVNGVSIPIILQKFQNVIFLPCVYEVKLKPECRDSERVTRPSRQVVPPRRTTLIGREERRCPKPYSRHPRGISDTISCVCQILVNLHHISPDISAWRDSISPSTS